MWLGAANVRLNIYIWLCLTLTLDFIIVQNYSLYQLAILTILMQPRNIDLMVVKKKPNKQHLRVCGVYVHPPKAALCRQIRPLSSVRLMSNSSSSDIRPAQHIANKNTVIWKYSDLSVFVQNELRTQTEFLPWVTKLWLPLSAARCCASIPLAFGL